MSVVDAMAMAHFCRVNMHCCFSDAGIPLSREEAKRIISRFSVNGTSIRYREFLK